MAYYHLQSWQNYSNGGTTGEEVLMKEEGDVIPAGNQSGAGESIWYRNQFFSDYAEARAQFDLTLQSFYQYNIHASIVFRDEVKGEIIRYNG